jgi:hypothetical protein
MRRSPAKGAEVKLRTTYLAVLAALVLAAVAVPVAQAGTPPALLNALETRGQALDNLCASTSLAGASYRAVCGTSGVRARMTPAQLQGLEVRGQALNHRCDSGQAVSAAAFEALCGEPVAVTRIVSESRFGWRDFGMGAGAMLGFLLLAGGVAAGVHYGRTGMRPSSAL